jgi:hypothetical protein
MTDNQQLDAWARKHHVPFWEGVHASDDKPDLRHLAQARVVFNWSPSTASGTHWLCFVKEGRRGYWFDSMGLPPSSRVETEILGGTPHFVKWIEERTGVEGYKFNPIQIEALKGTVCGQYAVYAAKYGGPQQTPDKWTWVTGNYQANDRIIARRVVIPGFHSAH